MAVLTRRKPDAIRRPAGRGAAVTTTAAIEGICCPDEGRGHILREIVKSPSRFQMDYVDIYLLDHPGPATPIEEMLDALNDLVQQGKVRYVGCCNFSGW